MNNVFRCICNEPRDCSASYMFVSRGLPTCKMLIIKNVYSVLTCIARSGNAILQSITSSGAYRGLTPARTCQERRKLFVPAVAGREMFGVPYTNGP